MNAFFSTPRSDDVLMNLSPGQRLVLNQWLADHKPYRKIRDDLAKPPPLGFSIQTSHGAVGRYHKRLRLEQKIAQSNHFTSQLPNPATSLKNLLHQSALTTALQVQLPPATFQILARYHRALASEQFKQRLGEQRDLQIQITRDRLDHHRRVFEFNAARAALAAACELQKIANDPTMDDEQKIWAARSHLFGALPDTQPQPKPIHQFIQ